MQGTFETHRQPAPPSRSRGGGDLQDEDARVRENFDFAVNSLRDVQKIVAELPSSVVVKRRLKNMIKYPIGLPHLNTILIIIFSTLEA